MADEELPQYEVDLQTAKDEFREDKSDDNKQAVREAKGEARYQRWLARGGPRESTFEKMLKEHGVVPGRFLEQWLLDRWLEEGESVFFSVEGQPEPVEYTPQQAYDQWVAEADEAARAAQKESA